MHNNHHIETRDGYTPIVADERFMKAVPPEQSFVADFSHVSPLLKPKYYVNMLTDMDFSMCNNCFQFFRTVRPTILFFNELSSRSTDIFRNEIEWNIAVNRVLFHSLERVEQCLFSSNVPPDRSSRFHFLLLIRCMNEIAGIMGLGDGQGGEVPVLPASDHGGGCKADAGG